LNVSPDAFIQMAFQIGFYRLFGRTVATYESTSTRGFHRGRTETSRSISDASKLLCQRMVEVDRHGVSNLQHQGELEDLFRKAVAAQSAYTAACARGQGIDRHLLGLRLSLKADDETPELFLDTAFKKSQHWVLSTSQISDPTLDVYGWGEVVPEGFGVAYSINDHSIHFGISSRNRGSRALADAIHQALLDSYEILRGKWKPNACEPATYSESLDSVDTVVEKLSDIKCTATDAEPNPATSDGAKRPVLTPRVSSSSFVHSIESRLVRTLRRSFHWVSASAGVKSSTSLGGGSGSGASN
ncbi:Carnitine O-acetyltransferase mitochondrial, partial [Spiromyces aspiralis]